jgi:hypothetical protein
MKHEDEFVKIEIVIGHTGEYDGRSSWLVCAYEEEGMADKHIERATNWLKKHNLLFDKEGRVIHLGKASTLKNPFDPKMQVEYTGVYYLKDTVTLKKIVKKGKEA